MEWFAQNRMGKRWWHVLDVQSAPGFPEDTSFHWRARYLQNRNLSSLSLSSEPIKISPCIIWVHLGGWRFLEGNMSGKLSGGNYLLGTGELASVPWHWEVLWGALAELHFFRKRGIWKAACIAEGESNKYMYFSSFLTQIVGVSRAGRSPCSFCKGET